MIALLKSKHQWVLDLEDTSHILDQAPYFIVEEIKDQKKKDLLNLVFCGLLTAVIPNCMIHKDTGWGLMYLFPLLPDHDLSQVRASTFELIFSFFPLQCVLGIVLRDPIL